MLMVILVMAKNLFENRGKSRLETIIWCIQLILLSAGVISIVFVLKTAVIPYSFSKVSTPPTFWFSFKSWLSPPYIYIIINFIILVIATSSHFHGSNINEDHHHNIKNYGSPRLDDDDYIDELSSSVKPPPTEEINVNQSEDVEFLFSHPEKSLIDDASSLVEETKHIIDTEQQLPLSPPEEIKHILVTEQQLEKTDVEDFENTDTMEATWEAIIEAGKLPAKKELKKMETWNAQPQVSVTGWKEMRKLETFNESVLGRHRGGMRRDVSMSQDELKNRAEAFINKFNKDMRLQRQKSEQRFLEMIYR